MGIVRYIDRREETVRVGLLGPGLLASRGPATQPMPVCTMGYWTPTSWQNRVVKAGWTRVGACWSGGPGSTG